MATLTLSTAIKDKVAYLLFSQAYASLTGTNAYQASIIDGEGASALTQLQMLGQYLSLAGGTALSASGTNATGVADLLSFEPVFVSLIKLRCAQSTHPERCAEYRRHYSDDLRALVASFNRQNTDYDPAAGATAEAFVYTLLSSRNYVLAHTVRMNPPLIPDIMTVDAAFDEVVKSLWNRAGYRFRRRPVTMSITRTAFTGGTWTESTKTLSGLTSVGTGLAAGTRFYLTGGTSANLGEYVAASTSSTTIVLTSSIGSAANGSTDIAGFYVTVSFGGLESGETFDSISTVKWAYTDASHEWDRLEWLDGDQFQEARAINGTASETSYSRPRWFRNHAIGSTTAWQFSPPPDTDYTCRGEVLVTDPTSPVTAGGTTATAAPFTKFASEWGTFIRRKVLDQVKVNYGRGDDRLSDQVAEEVDTRFSNSQGAGAPEERGGVTDVYQDHQYRREFGGAGSFGGTI